MESKGLVVMFGWTGAKQRHVENHAKIWTRLGFDGTSQRFFSGSNDIQYIVNSGSSKHVH